MAAVAAEVPTLAVVGVVEAAAVTTKAADSHGDCLIKFRDGMAAGWKPLQRDSSMRPFSLFQTSGMGSVLFLVFNY